MTVTRRNFTKGLAGGLALGTAGLSAPAVWAQSNMPKIKYAYPPTIDSSIPFAALKKGWYAEERIDVEMVPSPAGVPMSTVLAGEFQMGLSTTTTLLLAAEQGFTLQAVYPSTLLGEGAPDDVGALIIRKGSGLTSGASLAGKRVGVPLLNNLSYVCTRLWIDATGGNSSEINISEAPVLQGADLVVQERLDTYTTIEPILTGALNAYPDQIEIGAYPLSSMMPNAMNSCGMATQEFTEKNKDMMLAFSRATNKAIDWVNANKRSQELGELVASYSKMSAEAVMALTLWPKFGKVVPMESIDRVAKAMEQYGLIKSLPDTGPLVFEAAKG